MKMKRKTKQQKNRRMLKVLAIVAIDDNLVYLNMESATDVSQGIVFTVLYLIVFMDVSRGCKDELLQEIITFMIKLLRTDFC